MATLYEIDKKILNCIDQETGEVIDEEKLNALRMKRDKKIEKVALWVKNLTADVEAYKAEKDSFAEKEKVAKNKIESLKNWLKYATEEQKFQTAKVAISYRRSESVEIENEEGFIEYAHRIDRDDLLTFKEPTINKTAIKAALKAGQAIEGAQIVEKQNIQIK